MKNAFLKSAAMFCLMLICCTFQAYAQDISVSGKVQSEKQEVLPGVTIAVKGTTVGTITDIDGKYTLKGLSSTDVLVFSFIGFKSQEITVGTKAVLNVSLAVETTDLDEVVAIGYGTQKKKLVTGANLNVGGEDIAEQNTASAMDALKGVAPGLLITQNTAAPGAGSKVSIRGIGTTGNSTPTYIVDGVVQDDIDYLSPSDIESIDVFKDAASAAIYGNRGANGVILVTTKKGKKDSKPMITYDGYYGIQNVVNQPDLLNAYQYIEIMNEQEKNSGSPITDIAALFPDYDGGVGNDWFESMKVTNAVMQSHSVGINGGSERSTYSMGLAYFDQEGVFGKQADPLYRRINVRLNSEHALWKIGSRDVVSFGQNLTYSNSKMNSINSDVRAALTANPLIPVYDENGEYAKGVADWDVRNSNPAGLLEYGSKYKDNDMNNASGNFYLKISPMKNLTWQSRVGFRMFWRDSRSYTPVYDLSDNGSFANNTTPSITQSASNYKKLMHDNTLTYSFDIDSKHNFEVMVGNSMEKNIRGVSISATNNNFIFDDWKYAYLDNTSSTATGALPTLSGSNNLGWGMLSYFGRVSYNLSETWMLSALVRADGSSRFAEGNRWGYFPSVSAGYVLTNANFMKGLTEKGVDFVKLRASWGQLGNESVSDFLYSSTITYSNALGNINYAYDNPGSSTIGSAPSRVPNPDLSWEISEQLDFGLDAYFLASRLKMTFDWYRKDTKDWLVATDIPSANGMSSVTINGGSVRNQGVELGLNWNDKVKEFKYGASVSLAFNKNEVMDIQNSEGIIHGPSQVMMMNQAEMFRAEVGMPIGYFWGYETDGIMQNDKEMAEWVGPTGKLYFDGSDGLPAQQAGDFRYVDQNNDGKINDLDKVMIGNPNPDVTLGIQLNAEYKGFYFNTTLSGAFGHQIALCYRDPANIPKGNYTTAILDRWHGEGTSNTTPRISMGANRNQSNFSDYYVHDADYLRIANLTVGYDLAKIVNVNAFKALKLYMSVRNLHTFTNYIGADPEVGYGGGNAWASGIDLGTYPQARTFMLGLNVRF